MDAIKNRLLSASDKALRDVRKEQIDAIIKAIENIAKRFIKKKDDREKITEVIKLDLCNRSLVSEFLERKIQGIKDLSDIVKSNSWTYSSSAFTN